MLEPTDSRIRIRLLGWTWSGLYRHHLQTRRGQVEGLGGLRRMSAAAQQRDAADEGRLEASGSISVGTVIVNQGKVVRPSQLIASVRRTPRGSEAKRQLGWRTMRTLRLALLALSFAEVAARADDEVTFSRLQGTYASSTLQGWLLRLDAQGDAVLDLDGPISKQKAIIRDGRVGVRLPRLVPPDETVGVPPIVETPWSPLDAIPWPRVRPRRDSWPPSLQDPTAPVVMPRIDKGSPDDYRVWLTPVFWSPRLYLVRDIAAFCREVAAGTEPRAAAEGTDFLRVGDHEKAVAQPLPVQCRSRR
jgi:hypothetical protein